MHCVWCGRLVEEFESYNEVTGTWHADAEGHPAKPICLACHGERLPFVPVRPPMEVPY